MTHLRLRIQKIRYWFSGLIIITIVAKLYPLIIWRGQLPVSRDSLIFQHSGWYVVNGGRLYVDYVEVKPPAIHEMTAILAIFSGDNMLFLHILSIITTNIMVIGSIILLSILIYIETEEMVPSLVGSISMFSLPGLTGLGWAGAAAKPGTAMFGLLAIYFARRSRFRSAGATAAISTAFWHIGIIFPALVVLIAWSYEEHWRCVMNVIFGGIVTSGLILFPIIAWGGVGHMIMNVLIIPASGTSQTSFLSTIIRAGGVLRWGGVVVLVGIGGAICAMVKSPRILWPAVGGLFTAFQVLFLDFDGWADLYLGMVFISFGVGFAVKVCKGRSRSVLVGVIILTSVLSIVSLGTLGLIFSDDNYRKVSYDIENSRDGDIKPQRGGGELVSIHQIYWGKLQPSNCYYTAVASGDLMEWIERTNSPMETENCPTVFRAR